MKTRSAASAWILAWIGGICAFGCGLTAASDEELLGGGGDPDGGMLDGAGYDVTPPDGSVWPCQPTEKRCDGVCVDMQGSPATTGCDKVDCIPCPAAPNTAVTCANYECVTGGCENGFGDCDADVPGCETSLSTMDNCGECGKACSVGSGVGDCSTGTCQVVNCETGWGDCDGDPANGCETNLSSVTDCTACGVPCTVAPPDVPSCSKGYCDKVCDPQDPMREDCDGDPGNGCEARLDTLSDCGGCGLSCSRAHATATCGGGICRISSCDSGWGDCDGIDENGCERDVRSSVSHCGGCDADCSSNNVTNQTCTNSECRPTCANLWADCDGPDPGDSDDGCETPLDTVNNCGGCGDACSLTHATPTCPGGVCQIQSCTSPWENCDNVHSNGCETNVDSDVQNCGQCFLVCSASGATPSCSGGNCGLTCNAGWGDCDGNASNGCETNTSNTVAHCGGCNQACSTNHISPVCTSGSCTGTCDSAYDDCNANKRTDGCETNVSSDISNCGACGQACSFPHAVTSCVSSSCTITACDSGWSDCDGNTSTGCESDVSSDVDNCGGCGWSCSSIHVIIRECVGGLCFPVCGSNWEDLNGPQPGNVDDGCEATH